MYTDNLDPPMLGGKLQLNQSTCAVLVGLFITQDVDAQTEKQNCILRKKLKDQDEL